MDVIPFQFMTKLKDTISIANSKNKSRGKLFTHKTMTKDNKKSEVEKMQAEIERLKKELWRI